MIAHCMFSIVCLSNQNIELALANTPNYCKFSRQLFFIRICLPRPHATLLGRARCAWSCGNDVYEKVHTKSRELPVYPRRNAMATGDEKEDMTFLVRRKPQKILFPRPEAYQLLPRLSSIFVHLTVFISRFFQVGTAVLCCLVSDFRYSYH